MPILLNIMKTLSIKPLIQHVQQTQYPLKENKTITGAGTQVGGIRIEQNHFLVG